MIGNINNLVDFTFFFVLNHKYELEKETKKRKLSNIDEISNVYSEAIWILFCIFLSYFNENDEHVLLFLNSLNHITNSKKEKLNHITPLLEK